MAKMDQENILNDSNHQLTGQSTLKRTSGLLNLVQAHTQ